MLSNSFFALIIYSHHVRLSRITRPTDPPKDVSRQNSELDEFWDELSQEEESFYGASPPRTPRQMKRMSGKHQRGSQARAAGRSPNKGENVFPFIDPHF